MPRNQITTEIPARPVWVIGLEYLELSLLNWFVTTQMLPVMTRGIADAEIRQGLTRERLESLMESGGMFFRAGSLPSLRQHYAFFTKTMVKAVRNHSDKILNQSPGMFSGLTRLEFEAQADLGHGQRVNLQFQANVNTTPDYGLNTTAERYEYRVSQHSDQGFVLYSAHFPVMSHRSSTLGVNVAWTDSWISNPNHVRLPQRVIDSLSYGFRTDTCYAPIHNRFIDNASYILDWLSSDAAPKNLTKLNYFDANRMAKEWHDENSRRRLAAMRQPVGREITEVDMTHRVPPRVLDLSQQRDMDVFMAGRQAGRTTQFRAMFDLLNAEQPIRRYQEAATRRYLHTTVTESDYTVIWERHGWRVLALESNSAFVKESELMSHCIGESPRYWRMKEDDPHHYIAMTLRSPAEPGLGKATATFDYYPARGFTQLKGENNQPLTLGASDMFAQFLDDIARFGVEYTSPLFTKDAEEYTNGMPFPMIYAAKWPDAGDIATAFHGDSRVVKNYLDRNAHLPSTIDTLLNPITKSNLEQIGSFVRMAQGEEVQIRFLEEPRGGLTWVGVDEVAPLHEHQRQAIDRMLRTPEGTRLTVNPYGGVSIQELIARDPNPCNEVELPVGMEQQPSRVIRPGDDTPPPAVVTIDTGQAVTIHLPEAPEGTTFRIYRNRGN